MVASTICLAYEPKLLSLCLILRTIVWLTSAPTSDMLSLRLDTLLSKTAKTADQASTSLAFRNDGRKSARLLAVFISRLVMFEEGRSFLESFVAFVVESSCAQATV